MQVMVTNSLALASSEWIGSVYYLGGPCFLPQFSWRLHWDMVCTVHHHGHHPAFDQMWVPRLSSPCQHHQCWVWTLLSLHWVPWLFILFMLSLVESGYSFYSFFWLSFVLLFCIVLFESIICHKKENQRVEQSHPPYKPVVQASLTDQWVCSSHQMGIHLDKLHRGSPIKLGKAFLPPWFFFVLRICL